ncbi:MAG: hypothetical protein U0491_00875 [Candidatus Saccharimonadales bacterium]
MDEQNQQQQPQVAEQQWQYQSGQLEQPLAPVQQAATTTVSNEDDLVQWTASEFVSHEKNGGWYILLGIAALLIAVITFVITKEIFSIIVVFVLALAVGVFGALKPRTLNYAIAPDGITVGEKHFTFETFRSFAVIEDGPVPSIQLLPQKRFMVPITMYFDPNNGDEIIETLGQFLPFEHKERDMVDKISSRIRF